MKLATSLVLAFCISAHAQTPSEYSKIERMVDTRDPATISGSAWTKNLDCTFKNPPPDRIAGAAALTCEDTTHNLKVLSAGGDYFVPRGSMKNEPPYCLVKNSGNAASVQVAKERRNMYCQQEWSWWQKVLASVGVL